MSREIDALIAEKVMGFKRCANSWEQFHKPEAYCDGPSGKCYKNPDNWVTHEHEPWSPSENIAAAWEVVEKMGQWNGFEFMLTRTYKAHVGMEDWSAGWVEWDAAGFEWRALGEHGTSVPMAICLAALKAVGVSTQSPKEKS